MAELAAVAAIASAASTALTAVGTVAAGNAAAARGEAANRIAGFEAAQIKQQGKDDLAAASAEMKAHRRQKTLALSTLQARAGAGGFSATDPTALGLAEEIEKYGTLQEQTALYGGHVAKERARLGQAGRVYEGAVAQELGTYARDQSYLSAAGTLLGGASSLAEKYGKKTPAPASYYYARSN